MLSLYFLQIIIVYALNSSSTTDEQTETAEQINETKNIDISKFYENDTIKIYNSKQLQATGTNIIITSKDDDKNKFII